jgi:hypothetical protein
VVKGCARARTHTHTHTQTRTQRQRKFTSLGDIIIRNTKIVFSTSVQASNFAADIQVFLSTLLYMEVGYFVRFRSAKPILACLPNFCSISVNSNNAASSIDITASYFVFTSRLFKYTDSYAGHREPNVARKITTTLVGMTDSDRNRKDSISEISDTLLLSFTSRFNLRTSGVLRPCSL